jgi:suppressor of ftsI
MRMSIGLAAGLLLGAAQADAQSGFCLDSVPPPSAPVRDLHCVDLVPTPDLDGVTGVAEIGQAPTPFGLAVTADGHLRYTLTTVLRGLPDPASLGPYRTYVAWLVDPTLAPVLRLGAVANGTTYLGEGSLDKFLLIVSAESADTVSVQRGRPVLRGMSPSTRLGSHGIAAVPSVGAPASPGGGAHRHSPEGGDSAAWRMPPMPLGLPMVPGLSALTPRAEPWLPRGGSSGADAAAPAPRRQVLGLHDGDSLTLVAAPIRRRVGGREVTLYGFNGQVPGPLLAVRQEATIHVRFENGTDLPTAVHWHGVRLDNRSDGVPHVTQDPVPPGGSFHYTVHFPDAGLYWYHPHHREDLLQDAGLAGAIQVRPADSAWLGPAHGERVLVLDDLLADGSGLIPWGGDAATHALMGRFGSLLLVNGEASWTMEADRGAVVRLWLVNVSNTRTWNVSLPGARMKLVASDLGRFDRESWVESVLIGPAERYAVDVRFEHAGRVQLLNQVRAIDHLGGRIFPVVDTLGVVTVRQPAARPDLGAAFDSLRTPGGEAAEAAALRGELAQPASHELVLTLRTENIAFGLERMLRADTGYAHPLEFVGTMPEMDWLPTSREARWIVRDPATGQENDAIRWRFRVGDRVRLRLRNDRSVLHPMAHPIHLHGQRFLVLARNGVPQERLAWKDTAIVPVGGTVDLLVEMTNPGRWMLHCHIAEHLSAGMATVLEVDAR